MLFRRYVDDEELVAFYSAHHQVDVGGVGGECDFKLFDLARQTLFVFYSFEGDEYEESDEREYGSGYVKTCPHAHAYDGDDPYAGGRGESAHTAVALYYGAGAEEAYACEYLGGDSSRVGVEVRITLRYP